MGRRTCFKNVACLLIKKKMEKIVYAQIVYISVIEYGIDMALYNSVGMPAITHQL